jgi:D-alanine-D-alanine ligase
VNRTRVAVILGGRSSEHSISCISGRSIVEALDPARYEITVIGIGRDGSWVTADSLDDLLVSDGPLPEVSAGAAGVSIEAPSRGSWRPSRCPTWEAALHHRP